MSDVAEKLLHLSFIFVPAVVFLTIFFVLEKKRKG